MKRINFLCLLPSMLFIGKLIPNSKSNNAKQSPKDSNDDKFRWRMLIHYILSEPYWREWENGNGQYSIDNRKIVIVNETDKSSGVYKGDIGMIWSWNDKEVQSIVWRQGSKNFYFMDEGGTVIPKTIQSKKLTILRHMNIDNHSLGVTEEFCKLNSKNYASEDINIEKFRRECFGYLGYDPMPTLGVSDDMKHWFDSCRTWIDSENKIQEIKKKYRIMAQVGVDIELESFRTKMNEHDDYFNKYLKKESV